MRYSELKAQQQKRGNELPVFFAFNNEQFEEGLKKLNCTEKDLFCIPGSGFIRKEDVHLLHEEFDKCEEEIGEFLKTDSGLLDALKYELANYEYCITGNAQEALDALSLDRGEARVKRVLRQAIEEYLAEVR